MNTPDNRSFLSIYKASAGSGKTFTLAVRYIRMLVQQPDAYTHILAVTFTNKATTEMKQRILNQLYGIAHRLKSSEPYFKAVSEGLNLPEATLRANAQKALFSILHDYSHFRVETIDSFFQAILRNLAKELNLGHNMDIELDQQSVIREAVDELLRGLTVHSPELSWIMDLIGHRMDEGKGWRVEDELVKFAKNLYNEHYQLISDTLHQQLQIEGLLQDFRNDLLRRRKEAEEKLQEPCARFFAILKEADLEVKDLAYGTTGVCGYFLNFQKKKYPSMTTRAQKAAEDSTAWATKTSPRRHEICNLAAERLMPLLNETETIRAVNAPILNTCDLILAPFYQLRLINSINDKIQEQNRNSNRFLLADTCRMLREMQVSDTSFVFEKMGYYIHHIFIDEFQDTSELQWANFYLLLLECLSHGKDSLLVGDVKQAIYRWRGSDWRILNEEVTRKLQPFRPTIHPLTANYRSCGTIIRFNNQIFEEASNLLQQAYESDCGESAEPLRCAYADVSQEVKRTQEGYVKFQLVTTDETDLRAGDAMCRQVAEEVYRMHEAGVPYGQMTLLLRNNKGISCLARYFAEEMPGVRIVSNEAFRLNASTAVNLLINALRWIDNQQDQLALAELLLGYHLYVLKDNRPANLLLQADRSQELPETFVEQSKQLALLPLYELTEKLYQLFQLERIANQDAYFFSFFDQLQAFTTTPNNSLKAFLELWDKKLAWLTIPSGDLEGIQAMTIHKAKGLEFHTVIVPFCEWELEKTGDILWCNTDQRPPYDRFVSLPLKYQKSMGESAFSDYYKEEKLQQWVDNLNLLYVACTRATDNLILLKNKDKNNWDKEKPKNVGQLLEALLDIGEENLYESGTLSTTVRTVSTESENRLEQTPVPVEVKMHSQPIRMEFRQSNPSLRYIYGNEEENSFIEKGRILHQLFSSIDTADHLPQALRQLQANGLVEGEAERAQLEKRMRKALELPQTADWFSGRYTLFNECTLLAHDTDGKLLSRRPDRVMREGRRVIVVDFKFGKPQPQYVLQVQEYMQLLRAMDYQPVEGYLWYVYDQRIESVNL